MNYNPEIADGGTTFYGSINGHDSATFVPSGFHQDPAIRIILYFHGHQSGYPDLRAYINRPNTRPLRAAVAADGRYALVMPWLGTNSNASHIVASAFSFDAYVGAVCAGLWLGQAPAPLFPTVPNLELVLAAHSGGGVAMTSVISLGGSAITGQISSAWALDCFYSPGIITTASSAVSDPWINWARANPQKSMYLYYTGGTPSLNSQIIMKAGLTNVHGQHSAVGHDETPKKYFPALLKAMP